MPGVSEFDACGNAGGIMRAIRPSLRLGPFFRAPFRRALTDHLALTLPFRKDRQDLIQQRPLRRRSQQDHPVLARPESQIHLYY